ncbi:MAG: hypothetical protein Q8L07_04865 [Sediminibacterium sp.]|nr:hypothetical protein [Sediminibacterium sp.]MDP1812790.1 hypothetical protein [Sediminibacterium sp.]MDP3129525.1 hypothetical protein [Sediminibacterium sp.]MDP3665457.1 hypothetical protein [Sediminibacterium sp.]
MNLHLDVKILIITFCISLLTVYRKNNQNEKYLRSFPLFLLLTIIVEITGTWISYNHLNNTLLFNLYSVMEFAFFIYFFQKIITDPPIKKWITRLLYILPLICLTNICFLQGPQVFHTYSYTVGCLTIDTLGILYFFQLFKSHEKINLLRTPAFWIITGLVFFFTSSMSFLGIINYVATLPRAITVDLVKLFIFVNSLLYILFIIAFVCKLNIRKFIPSS